MFRLVLFLLSIIFTSNIYANGCALDDKNAQVCEIDSQNPPTFLNKFIDDKGEEVWNYAKCIKEETLSRDDGTYTLINCSIQNDEENNISTLTEGVIINKRIQKVIMSDYEDRKNHNVILVFAGKVIIEEGVNFDAKNLMIKIINTTDNDAQLIIDKNAKLNIKSLIIQNSPSPGIIINRCNNEENKKVTKEDVKDVMNLSYGIFTTEGYEWLWGDEYTGDIICNNEYIQSSKQDSNETMTLDNEENADSNKQNQNINANLTIGDEEPKKFLIIDKDNFDSVNRKCKNDVACLSDKLPEYDKLLENKLSSSKVNYNVYLVNIDEQPLKLICNITDSNGNNKEEEYIFESNDLYKTVKFLFPKSSNKAKLACRSGSLQKETNNIEVLPAKIMLNAEFNNPNMLKAGDIKLITKNAKALTLEDDVDSGFNDTLVAYDNDINFTYKNKCNIKNNLDGIEINKPLKIDFQNGVSTTEYVELNIKKVIEGKLNIRFSNENLCKDSKCVNANTLNDISVVPANFTIITDIISDNRIAYYGQLKDKDNFKFNPKLNLKLTAIDNNGNDIDINTTCNYGNVKLNLTSLDLIDFKRKASDKIDREIKIFNDEFENNVADVDVYFGVSKFKDENDDVREMKQNDLIEPIEIGLNDFVFDIQFTNNNKTYEYNDIEIYDRLEAYSSSNEEFKPVSVLIARGNLKINDKEGYTNNNVNVLAKYQIYCKSCDTKIMERYLGENELRISEPNWYVNTKHPNNFYLGDKFIKTNLKIKNSNNVSEGMQEIVFIGDKEGENSIHINQQYGGFAPYLNYNENYNNIYLSNYFKINLMKK